MTAIDGQIDYAYWLEPDGSRRIHYSLPAFHELDFQVNEGYRRIPHGGIEIGGILWGTRDAQNSRISVEAFRQIPCEHASGPSFHLSAADLAGLPAQLIVPAGDDELRELNPVGWFIAHTRGPLTITDRELEIFNQFFPAKDDIFLLVKPERFQPTRFAFAFRGNDGALRRDLSENAMILPLPGRGGKTNVGEPIPSIAAPLKKGVTPAPRQAGSVAEEAQQEPFQSAQPDTTRLVTPAENRPDAPPADTTISIPASTITAQLRPAQAKVEALRRAAELEPVETQPITTPAAPLATQSAPLVQPAPPAQPAPQTGEQVKQSVTPVYAAPRSMQPWAVWRMVALFLLAAFVGSAAGYLAYLQLPAAYIPMQVERASGGFRVQWPADQTQDVEYAAIRVNNGPPQVLNERERHDGQFELPDPGQSFKVEIIAQHWFRDSRGILRYLTVKKAALTPTQTQATSAALELLPLAKSDKPDNAKSVSDDGDQAVTNVDRIKQDF